MCSNSPLLRLFVRFCSPRAGNANTVMLICVTAAKDSEAETLSTLQFAARAMKVQTHARLNVAVDYRALALKLQVCDTLSSTPHSIVSERRTKRKY